jgi:hypothetical protein
MTSRRMQFALLLAPTLALSPLFAIELYFGGAQHFFLHTLMGWNVALLALLAASYFGLAATRLDGVAPLALALWANLPDLLYLGGTYHRDWMDIFLFHIAIDEILTIALPTLIAIWLLLMLSYARFRATGE